MGDLWGQISMQQDAAAAATNPAGTNFQQLLASVGHPPIKADIEALMSRCRLAESFLTGTPKEEVTKFVALAEAHIIRATNFVMHNHPLPVHAEFLRRAARRSQRKSRMKVFTTNYDRCYEEAGRQGRYVVVDGFSHTVPPTFDAIHFSYETVRRLGDTESFDPIPNCFHLYKLHGSVDWQRQEPSGEITKWTAGGKPVLIYPRNSKYELAFEQPYLEMIGAFQTAVREPDTGLLVVGFGFNDNHLAEPIMSAIRSNLSMKIVVVSPSLSPWDNGGASGPGECASNKYLRQLQSLAAAGDARITLLNCGFEEMVPFVPDLAAETDLERHVARLRNIGVA
ncbi:SIR2 family protein [Hydrogenophaga borbori]|uniref:SIR2 family protein n=2 Tax=Hydrogenophaga borbori TaxID=2294117 RepID=A0A372EQE2_9BURK|nr:SIR2 family protein [Hydrogenophaga borbori]